MITAKNEGAVTLDDQTHFNALMYADDLIILSTTQEGLQKSLDALNDYCKKWKVKVNYKKTKCMTFAKGAISNKTNFKINSRQLESTKEFKYLGITISSKNSGFIPTLSDLSSKANRAIYSLTSRIPFKSAPIKTMLHLFDAGIVPILLYGSEVWAPFMNQNQNWTKWDSTPIEKVHTQFLKRLLGVNRSTTNILTRSEVGRHPIQENIITRNINYIKYVESKDSLSLVKQAADYERQHVHERNTFYSLLEKSQLELGNHNIRSLSRPKLKKVIKEKFNDAWKTQIRDFTKAETYGKFKSNVKFESYLTDIKNRKYRVTYTKFRLSDHSLKIETGRHSRPIIPRSQRFCPFCPSEVEDEAHFLIKCTKGENRDDLFRAARGLAPNFENLNVTEQFIYLMSQEDKALTHKLVYKIQEWFDDRQVHFYISSTSLSGLQITVQRSVGRHTKYRPQSLPSLEVTNLTTDGLRFKITRKKCRNARKVPIHPYSRRPPNNQR